jgi:ribosome biogenesis protein NSA1
MASTGNDRYVRLHSTLPPPREAGRAQGKDERGDVLTKVYVGVVPTCVVWDGSEVVWDSTLAQVKGGGGGGDRAGDEEGDEGSEDEEGEQDVWDEMEDVQDEESDDDDEDEKGSRRKAGRKRRK